MLDYAHEIGLKGMALTDHDCISGYVQAEKHIAKRKKQNPDDKSWQDFKFIYGNEIYLTRNGLNKENFEKGKDRFYHFILLAKDEIGNKQIRKLSSIAWDRSYMSFHRRIPTYFSDLEEVIKTEQGHVIASSACLGSQIDSLLLQRKNHAKDTEMYQVYTDGIDRWVEKIVDIFGKGNFFLELQPGLSDEQVYVNKELLKIGKRLDVPCIVTTDSHYLKQEERKIHKAFLNSKNGDREVDSFYEAAYVMTEDEIRERMDYVEEEVMDELFNNTLKIGAMCEEYSIIKPLNIPYLPQDDFNEELYREFTLSEEEYPYFNKFLKSSDVADFQLAIRLYNFLFTSSVTDFKLSADTLEEELKIVWNSSDKMGVRWSKYFLQIADYMKIIWNEGDSIVAPSRGSAGASYLMYALDVIQIDKTREVAPLLFTRFLNPDRASVLDVDSDVESSKRNQIIAAMQDRYGTNQVVRVCTFKTETAKIAIKDAARGLGIDVDTSTYIASLVGAERGIIYTLDEIYYGNEEKGLKPNQAFIREMEKHPGLWETAKNIEGLVNGLGSHAGGVIVTEEHINETAATMRTTKGEVVTAFDLHDCEEMSLIKISKK